MRKEHLWSYGSVFILWYCLLLRLLFAALNSIIHRAGYKTTDKLQADIKQQTHIFEKISMEKLIEFIKRPDNQERVREVDDGKEKH